MDSSLISVDIQPNYVRVTLKGKSLQLALNHEIKPDSSTAKRSQTTGYLVIQMPKVNPVIRAQPEEKAPLSKEKKVAETQHKEKPTTYLEVDDSKKIDLANIASNNASKLKSEAARIFEKKSAKERENSPNFVDDSSVPPLE